MESKIIRSSDPASHPRLADIASGECIEPHANAAVFGSIESRHSRPLLMNNMMPLLSSEASDVGWHSVLEGFSRSRKHSSVSSLAFFSPNLPVLPLGP